MGVQGLFREEEHQRQACQCKACPEDVRKQVREPDLFGRWRIIKRQKKRPSPFNLCTYTLAMTVSTVQGTNYVGLEMGQFCSSTVQNI